MEAEEAAREASPGHEKGEGKRDWRAWPALKQAQGRAGVYLYPNNYFHPEQPKVALVITLGFSSVHWEKTHGNSPLDPTVLSIF